MNKWGRIAIIFFILFSKIILANEFSLERVYPKEDYDNGDGVEYRLMLTNTTNIILEGSLSFPIGDLISTLDGGGEGPVFNNIQNSITKTGEDTDQGEIDLSSGNLSVQRFVLPPSGTITYTIKAHINPDVNGIIKVEAKLFNTSGEIEKILESTMSRVEYDEINIQHSSLLTYYEKNGKVTYNIILKNLKDTAIKDIEIIDILDNNAFMSSVITGKATGTGTSSGIFDNSGDLNVSKATLGAGGTIIYTIEGDLKDDFTETLNNEVSVTIRKNTRKYMAEPLNLAKYSYNVEKKALNSNSLYSAGDLATYEIKVRNTSPNIPINNMSLIDSLSLVNAYDSEGNLVPAFNVDRAVVIGSSDSNSSEGNYNPNAEPNITNISIGVGEEVRYFVSVYINDYIVGEIVSSVVVTDRNGESKIASDGGLISEKPNIILEKSTLNNERYIPGSSIKYQIKVKNIGKGIGYNFNVVDKITEISSNLANNGSSNAKDENSNPITSWSIEAVLGEGSTKSKSSLLLNGGQINNENLDDTNVVIYPGEEIIYNITLNTKNIAIGDITNIAIVDNKTSSATYNPQQIITTGDPSISITKFTNQNGYEPGGVIVYEIIATNSDILFANNVSITDKLSKILALDINGNYSEVVKDWRLNFISKSGNGTAQGQFDYGLINPDKDLDIVVDIAPGGEIRYELIITVNPNIVGNIFDENSGGNIVETGDGITMFPYKLELQKEINETEYTPGKEVIYEIIITNSGDGTAVNIPIKDLFSNIKTQLITGTRGDAYEKTQVSAVIYNQDGSVSTSGPDNPGFSGILENKDLDVLAIISPGKSIVYTVNATINSLSEGRIVNSAQVDGELISDRGVVSKATDVSISKSVDKGSYPNNIDSNGNHIGDEVIVYNITVSNGAESGIAMNVPVQDSISTITAELLGGGTKNVFKPNWTIETEIVGIGTTISGNPVVNGQDLDTKVNIAPGGRVVFKITGVIDNTDTEVFYGAFTNIAKGSGLSEEVTIFPKMPFLKISKSSADTNYVDGGEIDYTIEITNVGEGFANNAEIKDNFGNVVDEEKNKAFKSWQITGIAKGYGTTIGNISDNSNIDTLIDIAPGGSVIYRIKAQLNTGLKGVITNTAQIYDAQNQNTSTASASEDSADSDGTIFIRKTSIAPTVNPLKEFEYLIDVINNSKNPIEDIRIYDDLNKVVGRLANLDGASIDDINGKAFSSWEIYKNEVKMSSGSNDILNDLINTLKPQEKVQYKIKAIPNRKLLSQKIKNIAYVYNGDNIISDTFIENNVLGSTSGIVRTVDKDKYIPGEILTYKIRIAPNSNGYLNNFKVNEDINDLQVFLMDGSKGDVFYNPDKNKNEFTVEFLENESKISSGTKPIPPESIKYNTNLQGVVDIAQGDYLTYKISGKIRPDILGDINYKGVITKSYRQNLSLSKEVVGESYIPGQKLTYILRVENNSKGNAGQVPLIDKIQDITVRDSKGNVVPAFVPNTIKVLEITKGGYGAQAPNMANPGNINVKIDVPVGGYIQYKISGEVIKNAVGRLINTLSVDGDTVSAGADMPQSRFTISKTMDRYLDVDGVTQVTEGYVPNGYIKYTINIENKSQSILDQYSIEDLIGNINTNLATGEIGKAFVSWTITAETDDSSITDYGIIKDNTNIDTKIDIAPNGYIKYTILAKVNPLAVGNFTNSVTVNRIVKTTGVAKMASGVIVHTKKVYDSTGTNEITNYAPEDTIVYKIQINNVGKGTTYNQNYLDILTDIFASEAGNENTKVNPFNNTWEIETLTSGDITLIGATLPKNNENIKIDNMIIAQGGSVTFTIKATIGNKIFGTIQNISSYGQNTQVAVLRPYPGEVRATNIIKTLAGKEFSSGMKYKPGDSVSYEIKVSNVGKGILDNILISDFISRITTEESGTDTTVHALEDVTISSPVINGNATFVESLGGDGETLIRKNVDIGPGQSVAINITAKISQKALKEITPNVLVVNNNEIYSDSINPEPAIISGNKELVTSLKYKPKDKVKYKITLINSGLGYGNNIVLKDLIGNITTEIVGGGQGQAFADWTISYEPPKETEYDYAKYTYLNGKLESVSGLDTTIDIGPGVTVTFEILATLAENIVGDVVNKVTLGDKEYVSSAITLEGASLKDISVEKKASNSTYVPDGDVGFQIIVENNSDTTINNLMLTDLISEIKTEQAGGQEGPALASGWEITQTIIGDSENSAVKIPTNGDILNAEIDLAKKTKLTINILGKVATRSLGNIINQVKWAYDGSSEKIISAEVAPEMGKLSIEKIANVSTYAPNETVEYTLSIKNIGRGYTNNAIIEDSLATIDVDLVSGTKGVAFTNINLLGQVSGPNTKVGMPDLSKGYYQSEADIYPGDTLIVKIIAKVNSEAYGTITNSAQAKLENGDSVAASIDLNSESGILSFDKSVDKTIYVDLDELTYTLNIKNTGKGWLKDIEVIDELSKIKTTFVGGNIGEAFENPKDIREKINIAPMSTEIIVATGNLKAGTVGDIENTAQVNGNSTNEVISTKKIDDLDLSIKSGEFYKTGGEDDSKNTIKYKIILKNTGSAGAELKLIDEILKIQAASSRDVTINAFNSYKVLEFDFPKNNNLKLNVEIGSEITDVNIPIEVIGTLEKNGEIILEVEATLNESDYQGPITPIVNKATVSQGDKSNTIEATTMPYEAIKEVIKIIDSVGGKKYASEITYAPKDRLIYKIIIRNDGDGYLKGGSLVDNVDLLSTELVGGNGGNALVNYSWKVESSSLRTILNMDDFQDNTSLNTTVTLAPRSRVTITLTGDISKESLGVIPSNVVNFAGLISKTPSLNPSAGKLDLTKKIVSGNPYTPGSNLTYEVKLHNIGEGYLNDIVLKDIIEEIAADSVGGSISKAFTSWNVSNRLDPIDSIVYVEKSYPNVSNLEDILDIGPGAAIIFTIDGQLAPNIYGDILNTVQVTGNGIDEKKSVVASSKKAQLSLDNSPLYEKYSPNGDFGFVLTIKNETDTIAAGLSLTDLIKDMKVLTVDGSEKFPFKSGYTITTSMVGDITNTVITLSDLEKMEAKGDLAPNTTYIITITGIAIDDAVGNIKNSAILNYNSQVITKEAEVIPTKGQISITKTSLESEFIPNDVLNYQINVRNNGSGYATGVEIIDDLKESEAFEIQTITTESTSDKFSKVYNLKENGGVVSALADIHPGESVTINISVKVLETRIQPILNIAKGIYLDETFESNLVLNSTPGVLSIVKAQSSDKYTPTGQHYYILTIANSGNGWLEGVKIYDEVADIKTQILGGRTGSAFKLETLGAKILDKGISNLEVKSSKNLLVEGDISPNTEVTIVIGGETTENTVGIIENTARVLQNGMIYKSNTVVATQEIAKLILVKVAASEEYEVGKPIDYTLTLTNNTINNTTGVILKDLIDEVMVKDSDGDIVPAFKPNWKVSYISDPLTIVSGIVENGKNLEGIIDINSFDNVIFSISAEVIDNAVGTILNEATVEGGGIKHISAFESLPKAAEIVITKTPQMEKYTPGEQLIYNIKVSNVGFGYADDIVVEDVISNLMVDTPTGSKNAFDMSTAKISIKEISPGVVTTIKDEKLSQDLLDTVDIPPNGFINYEISANIIADATGPIINIANAGGIIAKNTILSENYKITASMTQEQTVYIPGKEIQFDLIVENIGLGYACDIDIKEFISNSLTEAISGEKLISFDSWKIIKSESQNLRGVIQEVINVDVEEVVNIAPKGVVRYTAIALVNKNLSGDIVIHSQVIDSLNNEEFKNSVVFIPPEPLLSLSKHSDKDSYNDKDEFIRYTLNIENKGIGNISGIEVSDLIGELKDKTGNLLFTDWKVLAEESGERANENITVKDNTNIGNTLNLRADSQNKVTYTVTGTINKGIDDTITNTFIAKNPLTGKIETASVSNYIKKIPDNEGELKVIKRALKKDVKVGEAIEYEVIVENNNESKFKDVVLKDLIPSGFKYIKGTTELVESGPDGVLNTSDDLISISEPVLGNGLNFPSVTMEPFTKFRVRYLLKPSIGVTFGKYKNQAYMILNGEKISNTATATVSIVGDSLLDTASIIGKVFYDENGDGYQNDGEKGIPGVRLITPTGIVAIT
ncbi:MAG: hypothetical protein ACRC8M_02715, partial [Cetobacterium sp.]|uniref:hypothetical protein n=1 Tax=Cetobacterium sp. TaxID=2071632 RepID=UPI003F2BDBA0